MSKKKGRDFSCPSTSNPHHVCADFCFEKISEKLQDVGKEPEVLEYPVQNKEMTKVQRKGGNPTSFKAVQSFNSCAGNFFSINHRERTKKIWVITERSDVHPDCKNATNPYHKCAEYCFKNIPNEDQPGQVMKLNNLEGEKIFRSCGRTSLQSQCTYESNPQDECTDFCFKNGPDSNTSEGENPMDDSTNSQKSGALPPIPCHNGVECFFEITPEQMFPQKALNPKEEIKTSVAPMSEVKLECRNANQYNIYDESCFHSQPEDQDLEAMTIAKEEKEVAPKPKREISSNCENVSNPYVGDCFKNVPEKDQLGLAATKSKEENNKIAIFKERLVNPECQFTSNPYHACAEYCFQKAPERERRGHAMTLRSIKKIFSLREATNVHPQCKFASNLYHECDADCFQNELDQNKDLGVIMKPNKETKVVVPGEKGVNPKCQFASNPYHVCAEYCFQNFAEGKMQGHVMKLNNQAELKKDVSHRETTDAFPRCKFESNSEGYPDKNPPVKSIPVTTKEKNRNSLCEKGDHQIMEFVEASKPIYNNDESSVAIILPDQILKNREDSNLVEESNPDSDCTDFSQGITMEVVTKDLMRGAKEVEMRITKEPSDAPPLLFDASGLFLEWAKYCSQENQAEYKIFMQVERRAFDTKNGQGNDNLKCHDSSNLAKVKSNSLRSSLPTSVLFFLGFLFALFKWTEVIHCVVMSSKRKSNASKE